MPMSRCRPGCRTRTRSRFRYRRPPAAACCRRPFAEYLQPAPGSGPRYGAYMEVQAAIEEDLSGAVAGTLFRCPQ
ncbi:hypothetical protein EN904_06130 [Mesorhizobium sp. M7A.F.Ca.CA.001.07.2.1]|nr:hypothetical protein EN983_08655 [Mesorhizobium sp. M7A.F.Ca.CA.004.08.2.1]RUX89156.1 hypothetical protein EN982_03595 [Mesorhizobium sp. M7A.F.Ca.CA.004.08.1.1]RUY03108.1 hypothetical protein EN985_17390 [Mesorhizobium sp. M7A.F.Ca.CA.004.04.1.1]RUY21078.1 hypothetical protein EN984_22420 [Mesorhizobium sp. M7A.F.Ca.CA.004.12.1.1]RUY51162.1 hypothetical protein EN973_27700 [Mesorhizobium sp. M7A.F.Ca.CA.001.12.1.1]RUY91842.1 hypothetical protein EN964_05650 [Mesorhizobium sp. M7A.F.Ca.CA.0